MRGDMLTPAQRYARECEGKRSYRSAAAARRWQRENDGRHPGTSQRLEPYLCTWCGLYHLGHKNRPKWVVEERKPDETV